jgi:hypothetical protein
MKADGGPCNLTVPVKWNAFMFRRNSPELGSLASRNVIGVNQKYINTMLKRKDYDSQIGDTGVLEDGVPPDDLMLVKKNHGGCSYEEKSSVVSAGIFPAFDFQGSSINGNNIAARYRR